MGKVRTPGISPTRTLKSPEDPEVEFVIKKATNREDVARQNLFSKVRYIQPTAGGGEVATERDFPIGDLQIETILLCLVGWNLIDEQKQPYEVNEKNLLDLVSVEERVYLYDEILKLNPIWGGGREAEGKDSKQS